MDWIACKDRMPPEGRVVIVYIPMPRDKNWRMASGCWMGELWNGIPSYQYQPTHWQPMPEPPKDSP